MKEMCQLRGWKNCLLASVTILLAISPRFFHLNMPFERDEGAYAYMADVIQRGGLPYLNAFDHKPPLIYYLYHLSFKLFDQSVSSPRIMATIFVASACLLLLIVIHKLTRKISAALFGALVLGMATASPAYQGLNANTELFTLPFILAGFLLLLDKDPPLHSFFSAGLLFGTGFMVKQPVAVIALFPLIFHAVHLRKTPVRFSKAAVLSVLGMSLPLGIAMLYFYLKGAAIPFWEACFSYNFGYMGQIGFEDSKAIFFRQAGKIANLDPLTWVAGGIGSSLLLISNISRSSKLYVFLLLLGSFFATAMGRNFYQHYFIFLLPAVALIAGLGFAALLDLKKGKYFIVVVIIFAAALSVKGLRFIAVQDRDLLRISYSLNPFTQAKLIGDYLRANAAPGSTVYILGSEAEILFYSGLTSATRVYYFYPLVTPTLMVNDLRREALVQLAKSAPDFVVIINDEHSMGLGTVEDDRLVKELFSMFSQYSLIGVIGDNTGTLVTGDLRKMRNIAGDGAVMLLLGHPSNAAGVRLTLGELLRGKGG